VRRLSLHTCNPSGDTGNNLAGELSNKNFEGDLLMRSKIAMSFVIMALVCALVGGATFALFTSSATNVGNTFAAGTVNVAAGVQTIDVPINNMAPGDTISGKFTVTNSGSLKQWFKVSAITAAPATGTNIFGGSTPAKVTFNPADKTELAKDEVATVNYTVTLPSGANNDYQGAAGTLSFKVDVQQFDHNPSPTF
jgi:predicted ribosomally synthesized peptide with SipW-like signal peptide